MQSLLVYQAADLHIVDGINFGDTLSFADDLILDDVYMLSPRASLKELSFDFSDTGLKISNQGAIGQTLNRLFVDCCLTLMSQTGHTIEAIVLVEVDDKGLAVGIYLLPLEKFQHRKKYALIKIDRDSAETKFAHLAFVSFAKGTRISLPTGEMKPIEELKVGDQLLTRDAGVQKVRWIGQSTARAAGLQAPVLIKAGALQNENDLILSPDHRVYIYQADNLAGNDRPETLVRVRHLVDGKSVVWHEIGYIDYYQLLFDEHQIIYAEGIAAESLLFDERILPSFRSEGTEEMRLHKTIYSNEMEANETDTDGKKSMTLLQKVMQWKNITP